MIGVFFLCVFFFFSSKSTLPLSDFVICYMAHGQITLLLMNCIKRVTTFIFKSKFNF